MADFSIIADVSSLLVKRLREEICPEPLQSPEAIQLVGPTDKNADFQLGLYLYDIRDFGEYRISGQVRGPNSEKTFPPRPLTLSYLLFLNSKAQIAAGAEAEQRILGRAIQALADHPEVDIQTAHLFEGEPDENAAVTFLNLSFEDKSKIWSCLNIPYQVAVYFNVSPVMLSSRRSEPFTRVVSARFSVDPKKQDR